MPSVTLLLKVPAADSRELLKLEPREAILNHSRLLEKLATGMVVGEVDAGVSATDPVAASQTLTLVSAVATDAITIGTITMVATATEAT